MKKQNALYFAMAASVLAIVIAFAGDKEKVTKAQSTLLQFGANTIDGESENLSKYLGQVIMIVNVASKCGNTPQYEALQNLYEKYGDQGFVILGFPANDFGQQEPGTNAEIKEFCSINYGVNFPMFSKITVVGEGKHPLYKYLTEETPAEFTGDITWNFTKFLISRKGQVVARFAPKAKPDEEQVIAAIEKELKS